jgi:hypothetical protein
MHETRCSTLMQKFVPQSRVGFFATNAPDPPHWILNSCFGVFLNVLGAFGTVRYYTKLDAERAEQVQLMQKFMPSSRIIIFRKERTRSTPLVPKLIFWFVLYHFGAFGIV